jgi:hypothetical protein
MVLTLGYNHHKVVLLYAEDKVNPTGRSGIDPAPSRFDRPVRRSVRMLLSKAEARR